MESIERSFAEAEEERKKQPLRAGRWARTAMATLLLLGGAMERIKAQEIGTEKKGEKTEQALKEQKAELPVSLAAEKEATEKIFDECRKLGRVMNSEIEKVDKVFADKNATSIQMYEALTKLGEAQHKFQMEVLKAQGVLSDAEMKMLKQMLKQLNELIPSGGHKVFRSWNRKFFEEWQKMMEEADKVESILGKRAEEAREKGTGELEKMKKDIDRMFELPKAPPPPLEKKIAV